MQRVFMFGRELVSRLRSADILSMVIPMAGDVTVSQCMR
jgi:hypothetical protein